MMVQGARLRARGAGRALRRGLAATLAVALGALALAGPSVPAWADEDAAPTVRSQSTEQMSSDPEVVYVNTVSDGTARTQNFSENWKFNLGDASGAEAPTFDDSSWKHVDVPHDYSIDQDYTKSGEGESAYKPGGVGWYRKAFQVGEELSGKRVRIDFDGVYMDATVYVNGQELGSHPYGYTPFSFDVTPYLKVGEQNVVAVRVNHQTPSSRWYSGSGIGRKVELTVTDPVHVARDGVRVTTPDLATNQTQVRTVLATTVRNDGEAAASVALKQTVFPRGGSPEAAIGSVTTKAVSVEAGASAKVDAELTAANPKLWDTEQPNLYTVRTEVVVDGKTVDTYDIDFGFRFFSYDANTGFTLNGKNVKIKGVCMHHDQGALGSVDTRAALERQVRILKEMGCNSIRTSHNTPSRELVDVCNEQGILLDEEIFDGWTSDKNGNVNDYARFFNKKMGDSKLVGADAEKSWAQFDLESSIARDANAPAVIMWSVGNEMITGASNAKFDATAHKNLLAWTKAADPTRPVTLGDNQLKSGAATYNPQDTHNAGGLIGINYADGSRYDSLHKAHPDWRFYGSETASAVNSRGVYSTQASQADAGGQQLTSYDTSCVDWGHVASQAWYDTITRDFVAGEYVWTGFDYLGEPTPWNGIQAGAQGSWPSPKNSYFGIIDTAGLPKDSYYFYQSQWNERANTLHILPAWQKDMVMTGKDGKVPVVVYTDAPEVELFFTPKGSNTPQSLGRKKLTEKKTPAGYTYRIYEGDGADATAHRNLYLTWQVPYADGTLSAKAYNEQGKELDTSSWSGRRSVTTAGAAARLAASVDRPQITAAADELAYVTVDVLDKDGNPVPNAADKVTVEVTGAAELAGLDNGSSPDHTPYTSATRAAFSGRLVAIVRPTGAGEVTVRATAPGLEAAEAKVTVSAAPDAPAKDTVTSVRYARFHYVKTGTAPVLPARAEVRRADGTRSEEAVAWDTIPAGALAEPGSITVAGTVAGVRITCVVTALDDVAALLAYSTATPVGTAPTLPGARQAVLPDGTVMSASFPVSWKMPGDDAWSKPGTVTVEGTASVFGRDVPVTATVRVQAEQISIGDNLALAGNATLMDVQQSIPEGQTSDSLKAVNDGKTAFVNSDSNGSNQRWSNYQYAQAGNRQASITFRYNTQMRFGQARVHFFTDSYTAYFPDAGTTKLAISNDGSTWTDVAVREEIGQENNKVKTYTYSFDPQLATYVRLTFTTPDRQAAAQNLKPCIGITEIELMEAKGSYTVNAQAALAALKVNGLDVPDAALARGEYATRALAATVEPTPAGNAAVTVLPAYDDVIKILLESEDHSARNTFTIRLNTVPEEHPEDLEYPVGNMKVSAGSEELPGTSGEGPVALAFDGKPGTMYHSSWAGASPDDLWVQMELAEPTTIDAVRYLPRQGGGTNGIVTAYLVQYSEDGKTWKDAAHGTWDAAGTDWRTGAFDKPVRAKFFRLKGVETLSQNAGKRFMSAAEIRLRRVSETVDIADTAKVTVEVPSVVTVDRVDAEHPVGPLDVGARVTCGDRELTYGVDYLVEIDGGADVGPATARIEGIGAYSGVVERSFEVRVAERRLEGLSVLQAPNRTAYVAGDTFDPTGLVLGLAWSDGSSTELAWAPDAGIALDPKAGATLSESPSLVVTASYQGKQTTFTLSVAAEPGGGDQGGSGQQPGGGQGGSGQGQQPGGGQGGTGQGQQPGGGQNGAGSGAGTGSGSGKGSGNGSGLPATGDVAAFASAAVSLAGVAVCAAGFRRRRSR